MSDQENLLQDFQDNLLNVQNEQAHAKLERTEIWEELQEQSDLLHFQKHQLNLVAQQMEDISEEIHDRMSKVEKSHHDLLNLAQDTNQKVNDLTNEVKSISQKTQDLEAQIQENKQNLEKVKQEAQLANERLDNYLKSQSLLNFDAENQNLERLQKSIQLKAEETKLLATLKLLEETKKLISPKPVIQNQEREWKVGIKEGTEKPEYPKMEGMPLDPNCRWAKEYTPEQLAEWDWDIRIHNENNESAPLTTPDRREEEKLNTEEENAEETNAESQSQELLFEQLEDAKTELLTRLQEIQTEVNKNLISAEKQKQKEPNPAPTNSTPSNLAQELEQAIKNSEANSLKKEQETLTAEWETIQQISQQVLAEPTSITPELDLNQKLEELAQQINELEASQVANQKQMTKWMLFLIIFLLEYVVYKKNGVLGLILLNVVLEITYYKKDAILQHRHLWEKYFLIIGYVIGNTLAYSAPENPKYKWPSVIAFNLITFGIYGYTLYQNKQELGEIGQETPQSTTASRYDDLLNNLNSEDQARQRKKQEREAAKKKLEEAERQRRENKLVEKDRKLKEEEERRNQERQLAEQEEQKRREAEEIRSRALQEEQARIFQQKLKNIEQAKQRAEANLANQQKANELAEQKKRDEITKLEKENQQEQERLAKQAELIEEQKIKQLESIALEDKEQRQLIEKRANEEKARIESEMNEKKRKNEEELKKQENALLKEKEEKQIEIARLEKEVELQRTLGEETKRLGREQERILREQKGLTNQLSAFRENLWQAVLNYYWVASETRAGTRNPNLNESGHLRDWLPRYPNMEFNLNFGDIMNDINWSGYKTAMQAFYRTAGNRFVNQYEFKRLLEAKVKSLDFLN